MEVSSKVDYEFTLKLNLNEVRQLLSLLHKNGGMTGEYCHIYDALCTECSNLNVAPF